MYGYWLYLVPKKKIKIQQILIFYSTIYLLPYYCTHYLARDLFFFKQKEEYTDWLPFLVLGLSSPISSYSLSFPCSLLKNVLFCSLLVSPVHWPYGTRTCHLLIKKNIGQVCVHTHMCMCVSAYADVHSVVVSSVQPQAAGGTEGIEQWAVRVFPLGGSAFLAWKQGLLTPLVIVQLLSPVWLWDPMDVCMPGFPVLHHLRELAQTHVYVMDDAIQPSRPLSPRSPPALSLSQHQGLFQWAGSSATKEAITSQWEACTLQLESNPALHS